MPKKGAYVCRATQTTVRKDHLVAGEPVALDIEFQQYKRDSAKKHAHRIGRIAIVNTKGELVLDVYAAYPREDGVRKVYPPKRFLVESEDLLFENGAVAAHKVERWVKDIVKDRTIILHGGKHDLTAFRIEKDVFASSTIIDTQKLYASHQPADGTPGLRTLTASLLKQMIQDDVHSPVEDAWATMQLWLLRNAYDRDAQVGESTGLPECPSRFTVTSNVRVSHPVSTLSRGLSEPCLPDVSSDMEFPTLPSGFICGAHHKSTGISSTSLSR